ncbi:MAG: transketolase family protein [Chloroflexi bacterium]|nr:transketolase family protein [Chloroflexota bacterium]
MPQEVAMREAYGKALVEMGRENPDIVVLDADLSKSTMTHFFAKEFPKRFFDCGIAEQNMVGIAAGLAASGKIPFASTFAVFMPGRCFDQVRMSIAQPRLNVKLVSTHSGITVGEDGISHQAIEDLALANSFPGFNIVVPADAIEAVQAVKFAAATDGPFYIRLVRPKSPLIYDERYRFEPGKASVLREGVDVAIIATGLMVVEALKASEILKSDGISCRVLNMSSLKPFDEQAVNTAATETGAIVTAEEHLEHGGLGSTVARIVAKYHPVPVEIVAIKDTYAESAKPDELMQKYGLTAKNIEQAVRRVIERKKR